MHKGGSGSVPSNYHPISVVPVVAKALENVVAQQLGSYFDNSQCLSPFQGAYHRHKSTKQLLLVAVDHITHALDHDSLLVWPFWICIRHLTHWTIIIILLR